MVAVTPTQEFLALDEARKLEKITTPAGGGGFLAAIARGRAVPGLAARAAAKLAGGRRPFRLGDAVIVVRHEHVREALARDLDFLIGPVNRNKIEEVSGPFILGMDRSPAHAAQRRALYKALRDAPLDAIMTDSTTYAETLLDRSGGAVDAVGGYARKVAAHTARALFGIGGPEDPLFLEASRSIFGHTFLNLGNNDAIRERAVLAGRLVRHWFEEELARRPPPYGRPDLMDALLRGGAGPQEARLILAGMLVGAIDTTASAVAKILCVLDTDTDIRAEFERAATPFERYGLCLEALRRWPHNPIVIREAAADTTLGKRKIRKGMRIFLFTHAAMVDASAFPDPKAARADRDRRAYFHFGGGLHPCAGAGVNALQIPMLVSLLVERRYRVNGAMRWAGPFPHQLPIGFSRTPS